MLGGLPAVCKPVKAVGELDTQLPANFLDNRAQYAYTVLEVDMKIAFIQATFPELASPKMYQSGKGEGGTMKVAIRNAVSNLLKNRALAHKRISAIKCLITLSEKAGTQEEPCDQQ